jgi:rSAM/selenodomain-associated transferase 1
MRDPSRAVVLIARAPVPGAVKTRLAAEIGPDAALDAYRALGRRAASAVGAVDPCRRVVAYTPADAETVTREWLGAGFTYEPQAPGELGHRMAAALAARWAAGADQVVLIGTDCPTVDAPTLEAAFAALADGAPAVFGPAEDGGYYLVGASLAAARASGIEATDFAAVLFAGVPWSSAHTLSATLARVRQRGLRVALLSPMRDVDTAADWDAWLSTQADTGA